MWWIWSCFIILFSVVMLSLSGENKDCMVFDVNVDFLSKVICFFFDKLIIFVILFFIGIKISYGNWLLFINSIWYSERL